MNKRTLLIITAAVLVALIAAAAYIYKSLSQEYLENPIETTDKTSSAESNEITTVNDSIVTAPDFSVTDKDGNSVLLSDFFGKPIVVNFWATWCSPCTSEMPHFENAYKTHGDEVVFLMVNVGDNREKAYSFGEVNGYSFPIYHDSNYSASMAYNVSSIPGTLFINASGELVHTQIGTMNKMMLETHIANIK
ncbi:MAG: TlpA family protein disulfide reductase [Ruminococcaceae bacterium]|nr:TlpA family protein disulfide reductase [Oscillospiraceae bacterium]